MLQIDDCVWGAIIDGDFQSPMVAAPAGARNLGTLNARITRDFALEGDLFTLVSGVGVPGPRSPIRLLIEWQAHGQIRLREDRDPNVQGPRCNSAPGGAAFCPDPVILYRVEDDPLAEFRLARDTICRPLLDQVNAWGALVVDYDADPPPEPNAKAELLDEIRAIVKVALDQLRTLTPPDSIAAEFAADLIRREAELAELEAEAQALRRGDLAEAQRLDASILPVNQAMRQFQATHRFSDCP